jgi:antitoxin CptB
MDHFNAARRISLEEWHRLRWRCRRGLLENDLVLERFLNIHGRDLSMPEVAALNELLALDDNSLWDIIAGRAAPPAPRFDALVGRLRSV